MEYSTFEVEDFLLDESFQQWVRGGGNNKFWENWIHEHPEKLPSVEKAKALLKSTEFYEKPVANLEIESELFFLKKRIMQDKPAEQISWFGTWQKIAASVLLLMIASITFYFYKQQQTTSYKTGYAETKMIVLPDQSKVTLNSNSEIELKSDFSDQNERIVYLKGEAFFEVNPTPDHQKFIVAANGIQVIVLGTKFNVNGRRGNVKVVLNSGKVKLSSAQNTDLVMAPGEMVEYNPKNNRYIKTKVSTEHYTSWKHNRLEFKNTPVKEIFQMLEDNYGLTVVVNDPSVQNRKLTGNFPADDIRILLESMGEVFDIDITQNKTQIIVGNNNK
jgi:transmembrane sensor